MVPPLMWMSYPATLTPCYPEVRPPCGTGQRYRETPDRHRSTPANNTAMTVAASWVSPKARKGGRSTIAGRGLFAIEAIAAGEVVAGKGGHIVGTATVLALPERLQETDIQIADGLHLAALTDDEYEAVMLFVNHSCDANVGIAGIVVLAAMRDVPAGEELTLDYCLFDSSPSATPMVCRCGAPSCRQLITAEDWR